MTQHVATLLRRIPFGRLGVSIAIAAAIVVVPLLAFSETTLKSMLDQWLTQCTVVVVVNQQGAEAPIVRLYSFGDMPESLPLTFAADNGLIERVSLVNHVEQETTTDPSILVHPLANQRCPGDLCPDTSEPSEKLTVRIRPVSPNYVYQLRVLFTNPVAPSNLKVYVKPLLEEKIACRIETATLSNFFARQPRGTQVLFLFLGVVVFTLLLGYLRPRSGGSS